MPPVPPPPPPGSYTYVHVLFTSPIKICLFRAKAKHSKADMKFIGKTTPGHTCSVFCLLVHSAALTTNLPLFASLFHLLQEKAKAVEARAMCW